MTNVSTHPPELWAVAVRCTIAYRSSSRSSLRLCRGLGVSPKCVNTCRIRKQSQWATVGPRCVTPTSKGSFNAESGKMPPSEIDVSGLRL